jgi:DNA polymerase elongation subunit (family B)
MKICYLDTETAPTMGYFYGRWDQNIRPDQVKDSGFFLSFQYAWNDGPVHVESLRHIKHGLTSKDDKDLCRKMVKIVEKADIVIGHNVKKFDIARLSARLASHRLKPVEPKPMVDTLAACRRFFRFEANSLDSVCQELGIGRKGHSGGFDTSLACMRGDQKAWDKLLEYGKQDVVILRDLYKRILPNIENHPNAGLITPRATFQCPKCESSRLQYRGYRFTVTMRYARFQCMNCGAWGSERTTDLDKEEKSYILRGA